MLNVYSYQNRLDGAMLMSTYDIHFHYKVWKTPKISLNICFLELAEEFLRELYTDIVSIFYKIIVC